MTDLRPQEPDPASLPPTDLQGGMEEGVGRALFGGAVAALLGGGIWTAIVLGANLEVGWVAWGIGVLVGLTMSKLTPTRGQAIGLLAAILAALGLVAGKTMIIAIGTKPALVQDIQADSTWMAQAALADLRQTETLPAGVQEQLDALSFTDTLPDALWEQMLAAGAAHAAAANPAERERIATGYATALMESVGVMGLFRSQLGLWDLLWFGLAILTAWRIMTGRASEAAGGEVT